MKTKPLVKRAILVASLELLFFSHISIQSALAADYFKTGCDFYARGEYQRAVRCFDSVIRQRKNYWPAYYQLANTYLALKEHDLARKYYDLCIEKMPDFKTAKACKLAIDHIDKLNKSKQGLPDDEDDIEDPALAEAQKRKDLLKEETKQRYDVELALTEKKKSDIMTEAMKRANAIRDEARRRIQEIHDEGNYWVRHPDSGEIGLGIPKHIHENITNEAEEKAKKIMDEAEARVRGIQAPREPDWESFKVHPSSVSRKSTGNRK